MPLDSANAKTEQLVLHPRPLTYILATANAPQTVPITSIWIIILVCAYSTQLVLQITSTTIIRTAVSAAIQLLLAFHIRH
jgi:hypothetical protein